MSVGYNYGSYYGVNPKKDVKKDGVRAGCVGALALGAATAGTDALIIAKQEKIKSKLFKKIAGELATDKKFKPWSKIGEKIIPIIIKGSIDWFKAGKVALIGGTIIGLAAALNSAMKKLPDETNYYA